MRFKERLIQGKFVKRLNRFSVLVEVGGKSVKAHLANSGRLGELLIAGREVYLLSRPSPHRKTAYDLVLMRSASHVLVSTDARLPNLLFQEYLSGPQHPPFDAYDVLQREVSLGDSRLDFLLTKKDGKTYIEVKSVTLVRDGIGYFPDSPTLRGTRHLRELTAALEEGHQAAVVFVAQRPDVSGIKPNDSADPGFGDVLRKAASSGVGVFGLRCRVSCDGVRIDKPIPVLLE